VIVKNLNNVIIQYIDSKSRLWQLYQNKTDGINTWEMDRPNAGLSVDGRIKVDSEPD